MNLICGHCGREFESNRKRKFCSKKCMEQDWHKRHYVPVSQRKNYVKAEYVKNCIGCGKEFIAHHKNELYCSAQCQEHACYLRNRPKKYCKVCGSEIPYIDGTHNNYCSETCRKLDKAKKCLECGNEFIPNSSSQKYCSRECAQNAQKDKTVYTCMECGKSFTRRKRGEDQCLFCSRECASEYKHKELIQKYGEKIYTMSPDRRRIYRIMTNGERDYGITLQKVYERDNGICKICGNPVNMNVDPLDNEYGSIDHIIPLSKGGTHQWKNVQLAHRICNSIKKDFYE